MEFSNEYVDHSKIQKVHSPRIAEDTNDKMNDATLNTLLFP